MALLNYTTVVPVTRTIGIIQKLLVEAGAESITGVYAGGNPVGLSFTIQSALGRRGYTLPVQAAAVEKILADDPGMARRYKTPEHAHRVAWRIVKDWLEAQLALVAAEMVALDQVMLPYMHTDDDGTTVYALYQEQARRELRA